MAQTVIHKRCGQMRKVGDKHYLTCPAVLGAFGPIRETSKLTSPFCRWEGCFSYKAEKSAYCAVHTVKAQHLHYRQTRAARRDGRGHGQGTTRLKG